MEPKYILSATGQCREQTIKDTYKAKIIPEWQETTAHMAILVRCDET